MPVSPPDSASSELAKKLQTFHGSLQTNRTGRAANQNQDRDALNSLLKEVGHIQTQAIEKAVQTRVKMDKMVEKKQGVNKASSDFTELAGRILSIEKVRRVDVVGTGVNQRMVIYTHPIFCVDPRSKTEHLVSNSMAIVIPATGEIRDIRMWNMSFNIRGYGQQHSAHSLTRGEPCWGDAFDTMTEMVRHKELYGLVLCAITFLESVNTDDGAGVYINLFPFFNETGNLCCYARERILAPVPPPANQMVDRAETRNGMTQVEWLKWWEKLIILPESAKAPVEPAT